MKSKLAGEKQALGRRSDEGAGSSVNDPEAALKARMAGPGPEGGIKGAVDQWASAQDIL